MKKKSKKNLIILLVASIIAIFAITIAVSAGVSYIKGEKVPFGAFRPAAPTATSTGNKFLDDRELAFGTDEDFQLKYNSIDNQFEWSDGTNNFFIMEDAGTTASTTFVGSVEIDSTLTVGGSAVLTGSHPGLFDAHGLLNSEIHEDTLLASVSRGSLVYGNSTPKWAELTIGASNSFIMTDGTDVAWNDIQLFDFKDFKNAMTLDANTSIASVGFTFDFTTTRVLGHASPSFITVGRQFATKEYVDTSLGGVEFDFFFNDTRGGFASADFYYEMLDADTGAGESSIATTSFSAGDDQFLAGFITATSSPTFVELSTGIYGTHFHAQKVSGARNVNIYWTLSKIDTEGDETVLITSEVSRDVSAKAAFDVHGSLPSDTVIGSTDRLLLKLFANVDAGGGTVDITIFQEGTLDSRVAVKTTTDVFTDLFVRRDGSVPLLADWAVGTFGITGIDELGAKIASISDSLTVADIFHTDSIKVDGTIDFPDGSVNVVDMALAQGFIMIGDSSSYGSALDMGASNSFAVSDGTNVVLSDIGGIGIGGFAGGTLAGITGITSTGVLDFGGATSFELPNAAGLTVDADGEIMIDTTGNQLVYFSNGDEVVIGSGSYAFDFGAISSEAFDEESREFLIGPLPYAITLASCSGVVDVGDSGETVAFTIAECNSAGAVCVASFASISAGNDPTSQASFSDASLDLGDYIALEIGAATATVDYLMAPGCRYTQTRQ